VIGDGGQEEGWVVCRIFKKKNHLKTLDSPLGSGDGRRNQHLYDACDEGALEQILQQMGRGCKEENYEANYNNYGRFTRPFDQTSMNNNGGYNNERYMKLPSLESPKSTSMDNNDNNNDHHHNDNNEYHALIQENEGSFTDQHNNMVNNPLEASSSSMLIASCGGGLTNWVALDRLVASQLNGQTEASRQLACFNDPTMGYCTNDHDLQLPTLRSSSSSSSLSTHAKTTAAATTTATTTVSSYISPSQDYGSEIDLWNFTRSTSSLLTSSEPLCHVSNTSV
jgi:hypothetical protein